MTSAGACAVDAASVGIQAAWAIERKQRALVARGQRVGAANQLGIGLRDVAREADAKQAVDNQ